MTKFKLKIAIDLLSKRREVTRKYGNANVEIASGFIDQNDENLKSSLLKSYQLLFKNDQVINIEVLDSLIIN